MNEVDKKELIELCLRLPCSECGYSDTEYALLSKQEVMESQTIIIPNVPTIRCKACEAIVGYPSFAFDHIQAYKANMEASHTT